MMRSRAWLLYVGVLGLVALAFFYFDALFKPPAEAYACTSSLLLRSPRGEAQLRSLPWSIVCTTEPKFQEGIYRSELDLEAGTIDEQAWYVLVLPAVDGNALRVSLNGEFLGAQGDFATGRSNIWNSVKTFLIEPGRLRERNRIVVDLLGIYSVGITKTPYVVERGLGAGRIALLRFMSDTSIWLLCGAIAIMGLTILAIGFTNLPSLDARMFLGVAALCTTFFLTDFLTLEYLPLPLLTFKRIVVALRHIAALLFTLGYLRLLDRRLDWFAKIFIVVQGFCALLVFFPPTMQALKITYTYSYLTIIPFQFYLFVLLFLAKGESGGRRLLLLGTSLGVIAAIRDSLVTFFAPHSILVSHIGFMLLMLATTAFVVSDILQHYRQLLVEKKRAELYREASLHDPLTGAYNRNVLPLVRESLTGPFVVVALDLDGFKAINDTYGHLAGDRILVDLVSVLNRVFRRDDYVVRSGGDEFITILPSCPSSRGEELALKLRGEIGNSRVLIDREGQGEEFEAFRQELPAERTLGYSASIGVSWYTQEGRPRPEDFEAILCLADENLYRDKAARLASEA